MSSFTPQITGFFDLPLELRTQIYTHVFDRAPYGFKVLARFKTRLLRINQSVYLEALALFYKLHQISLPIQDLYLPGPPPILAHESRFDLLVHLELVYENDIDRLDIPKVDINISYHLQFVEAHCHNLKTLRLELRPSLPTDLFVHVHYRGRYRTKWRPHVPLWQTIPRHLPFNFLPVRPDRTAGTRVVPGMTQQSGTPCAPRQQLSEKTSRLGRSATPRPIMSDMIPGRGNPPSAQRMLSPPRSGQRHPPPQRSGQWRPSPPPPGFWPLPPPPQASYRRRPPPPGLLNLQPSPPPSTGHPRKHAPGTYFIDKDGASVQSLKELWERLERFTIVIPRMGDFGEDGFQQYIRQHILEVVVPGVEWERSVVDYKGDFLGKLTSWEGRLWRRARAVEWSVSKKLP